ncbi:MAG: hypothetical protein HYS09_04395 [Chloroflexi bacterium]|nr:hypothetical protein [Chloroflexota bacterium]
MRKRSVVVSFTAAVAAAAALLLASASILGAPDTALPWSALGGGGGGTASSPGFDLGATAGQAAVGSTSSTNFALGAGYWNRATAPCSSTFDSDADAALNSLECHVGTGTALFCSADTTPDNEDPDARPTDLNDDRSVSGADLSAIAGDIGRAVPPASVRKDIAPNPAGDNAISGADLSRVAAAIGTAC